MTEYRVRCARSSTEGHRLEIYPRRDRDAAERSCAALNEMERRLPRGCQYIVEAREVSEWARLPKPLSSAVFTRHEGGKCIHGLYHPADLECSP